MLRIDPKRAFCPLEQRNLDIAAPWLQLDTSLGFATCEIVLPDETDVTVTAILNQDLGFDQVRWSTMRKTSYDSRVSFQASPVKILLSPGTLLYRLVILVGARPFDGVWWMPKATFEEIHRDANAAKHGGGRLFRNYVAQYMALPSGNSQLSIEEIELTNKVYAWVGRSASLFNRPGGLGQVYLPNLAERGNPATSTYARRVRTYWLQF